MEEIVKFFNCLAVMIIAMLPLRMCGGEQPEAQGTTLWCGQDCVPFPVGELHTVQLEVTYGDGVETMFVSIYHRYDGVIKIEEYMSGEEEVTLASIDDQEIDGSARLTIKATLEGTDVCGEIFIGTIWENEGELWWQPEYPTVSDSTRL